jgi:hypothetical protein
VVAHAPQVTALAAAGTKKKKKKKTPPPPLAHPRPHPHPQSAVLVWVIAQRQQRAMKASTNNEIGKKKGKKKRKEEDRMGEEGACWRNLRHYPNTRCTKVTPTYDTQHQTTHNTDRTIQVSDGWWNTRQIPQLVTRKRAKQGEGLDRGLASKRARRRSPLPTRNTRL